MENKDKLDIAYVYDAYALLNSIIAMSTQAITMGKEQTMQISDLCYGVRCLAEQTKQKLDKIEDGITATYCVLDTMASAFADLGVSV